MDVTVILVLISKKKDGNLWASIWLRMRTNGGLLQNKTAVPVTWAQLDKLEYCLLNVH
jgi:hypothetical protein